MALVEQVGALLALVPLVVLLWRALAAREVRRPGFLDRSPNGSEKPRWCVRPR